MKKIISIMLMVMIVLNILIVSAFANEIPLKVSEIKQEDIISRHQEDKIISDKLYETYNFKVDNGSYRFDRINFGVSREFDKGITYEYRIFKWNEVKGKLVPIVTEVHNSSLSKNYMDVFGEKSSFDILGKIPSYESDDLDSIGYYTLIAVKEPRFSDLYKTVPYYYGEDYKYWTVNVNDNNVYHINKAIGLGLINGTKIGDKLHFNPDEAMSKSEFYTIISKMIGAVPDGNSKMFDLLDLKTVDEANIILNGLDYNLAKWAKPYVSALYEKGFITKEDLKDDNFTIKQIDVLEKLFKEAENSEKYKDAFDYFEVIKNDGIQNNRNEIVKMIIDVLEKFKW